jgi:hypothetical protein
MTTYEFKRIIDTLLIVEMRRPTYILIYDQYSVRFRNRSVLCTHPPIIADNRRGVQRSVATNGDRYGRFHIAIPHKVHIFPISCLRNLDQSDKPTHVARFNFMSRNVNSNKLISRTRTRTYTLLV